MITYGPIATHNQPVSSGQLMIFEISYSSLQYLEATDSSLVIAVNFEQALHKWNQVFVRNRTDIRMVGIKIFWEFPII